MEHYLLLMILLFFYKIGYSRGYIETVEEFGCQDTEFKLTCRHLDSHIAILDGNFYPEDPDVSNVTTSCSTASRQNTTLLDNEANFNGSNENAILSNSTTVASVETHTKDYSVKNIRLSLNRRCSGINHCSFNLSYDTPGGRDWGAGLITFKYVCIAARRVTRYCNVKILLNNTFNEGFIQSPGYPRYYVGDINCNWKLIAPEGQLIQLMFVDVSLRINYTQEEVLCVDQLSVIDNNRSIFNSCLEEPSLQSLISTSSQVDINLEIKSKTMFPKRGILLYYKGIGCPTIPAPLDGYLADRNDTYAEYMCNVGFVFRDTQSRARILRCVGGNAWHTELPDCINTTFSFNTTSTTNEIHVFSVHPTLGEMTHQEMYNAMTASEYLVPIFLILALFVANGAIVYYIYRQRKRTMAHLTEEELAVIQQ